MRRHSTLSSVVALLLLAWIFGDMVGTGLCPGDVDPCAGSTEYGCTEAGLPHGQHAGMATLHVGHCLGHGVVTLPHRFEAVTVLEPLLAAASPSVSRIAPGICQPVYHPPQLAA